LSEGNGSAVFEDRVARDLRPRPAPNAQSSPYWDGARDGRLVIQRCGSCGEWNHPPGPCCRACGGSGLTFEEVSGRGSVYEVVVVHQTKLVGFEDRTPYIVAAVELDEQPRLIVVGNIVDRPIRAAEIGTRVEVTYETTARGATLPQFVPKVA
jgi:uncharacterized protein